MNLESFTRQSLLVLLALAVLIAFSSMVGGLMFAPILFRAERPFAIALWLATLAFPVWLLALLAVRRGSRKLYPSAMVSWLFAAIWVVINFVWAPSSTGRFWGW
jgi:hypothetical protein